MLKLIIHLQLGRVVNRIEESQGGPFTFDSSVVDLMASRCTGVKSGGRMVDAILPQALLPQISREFLVRQMNGAPATRVDFTVTDGNFACNFS